MNWQCCKNNPHPSGMRKEKTMSEPTFTEEILLASSPEETLETFYKEVCKRAEEKMLKTHKLEGAHYAAMTEIMKELELL